MITYEDFKKIELKVAKIISAERVEGSDKLIKLALDLGSEKGQIIAGIGRAYEPEDLIGLEIAVVANLKPKTLMGIESNGMLLTASADDGEPVLLIPQKEVPPGAEIR